MQSPINPEVVAEEWFSKFAAAFASCEIDSIVALFSKNGWYKDILALTFDYRALEGHEKIRTYLSDNLLNAQISNVQLDTSQHFSPELFEAGPAQGVLGSFTFETPKAIGKGNFRLLPDANEGGWKALTVMTMIWDWKGHEEQDHELGFYEGHSQTWQEVWTKRKAEIEADPQVIIIGGGQAGLQIAARFRQMNIKALIVEKSGRLGDSWRNRYSILSLHTPPRVTELLYQPYPSNWPYYTPKDKYADWIEKYAESQDLVAWTSSYPEPTPTYDEDTKRWNVVINRAGKQVELHPSHIVLAVGLHSEKYMPSISGLETFEGEYIHGSEYKDGEVYRGKHVVVVGSGNTGVDICQELVHRNAASVTIIQRSGSGVASLKTTTAMINRSFPEGVPNEICDFRTAGIPLGLLRHIMRATRQTIKDADKELLDGFTKAGFELTDGPDGSGPLLMLYDRGGGTFIDVGHGALISEGKIKVKSRVQISHVTPRSIVLKDGSDIPADVLIFATGYKSTRDHMRGLFGDKVIDRTDQLWGTDEEGEPRAGFKPSGQPGLWYAVGPSRFLSRPLALYIKAIELGYTSF